MRAPVVGLAFALFVIAVSVAACSNLALGRQGHLTVSPANGPVGTNVALEGEGCANPGQQPLILFGGTGLKGQGTAGSSAVPGITADQAGRFRVQYTIPSEIGPQQQWQGGSVVPGRYNFTSTPPICQAFFTVMSLLPSTGGSPSRGAPKEWALEAAVFVMLAACVIEVAVMRRKSRREG